MSSSVRAHNIVTMNTMIRIKTTFVFLCLLLCFAFMSSCRSYGRPDKKYKEHPNQNEYISFLSGGSCKAPCWHGLEVCKTTYHEAISMIDELTFLDSYDIDRNRLESGTYCEGDRIDKKLTALKIICDDDSENICARLNFAGELLVSITIIPNYAFTLEDAVNVFGEPDNVEASQWGPECLACTLLLLYPDKQLTITHGTFVCSAWSERCVPVMSGSPLNPSLQVTGMSITPTGEFEYWEHITKYDWPGLEENVP